MATFRVEDMWLVILAVLQGEVFSPTWMYFFVEDGLNIFSQSLKT